MAGTRKPPTDSQRVYLLWLVLTRLKRDLEDADSVRASGLITIAHAQQLDQPFRPMTHTTREREVQELLEELMPGGN